MSRPRATAFDKLVRLVSVISTPQKQKSSSMHEQMNLGQVVRSRTTRSRALSKAVKHPAFEKSTLNLNWAARKKRSKRFTRKNDLSSFANDISELQLSETFIWISSSIRTKLGALVEVQELIELHQDNVVYCNDDILHSKKTKSIEHQNSLTDFEDHINGVEMVLLEHRANIFLNYRDSDVGSPSSVSFVGCYEDEEENDEEDDVSANQDYDLYTKALVDFSSQVMEGLHINDVSNQLVLRKQNDALIASKEKSEPPKKRLVLRNQNYALIASKEKLDPPKKHQPLPKKRQTQPKVDNAKYGALDKFIYAMHLIQGDKQLSPWNGSVVDSVVSVLLTQNVRDGLSSQAFMNLASKFPVLSDGASDSAIHNSKLLRLAEGLSDEVDSEHLSIVAKDSIYCPSSQTQIDLEDGNLNSSQTESTSEERKGKDAEKQVTNHWDELRDFLERMVRDHGSIDLEWLRDVPPQEAKEYLLSIPDFCLKSVECVRLLSLHQQVFPEWHFMILAKTKLLCMPVYASLCASQAPPQRSS
ncbi:demeter-like protein 2 [Phtheirospermum japonicum]|uniref:Demeter-like protein 2 n=1 Tax=Phtheirospermum japonicum TaxID=374723 RepID=A0A830BCW2_9LAMI|nr:demeter-like protein 2 [Phtheirospermum japonicum]